MQTWGNENLESDNVSYVRKQGYLNFTFQAFLEKKKNIKTISPSTWIFSWVPPTQCGMMWTYNKQREYDALAKELAGLLIQIQKVGTTPLRQNDTADFFLHLIMILKKLS